MQGSILLWLACLSSTLASPIPSNSQPKTNSSQILAIIFCLSSFVSFLFIAKRVYLVRRRARTASFLSLSNSKFGFLVGFFGSPTWETRINVPTRFSFLYHLRSSSSSLKTSLYEFGERTRARAAVSTQCTGLSSTLCATSYQLPWDIHTNRTRRHSLPSICQSDSRKHNLQRTRHSSLKSTRTRRDSCSSFGHRFSINDYGASPLTPSPRTSLYELYAVATCPPLSRVKSRAQVRRDATAIPPLPPLPPFIRSPRISDSLLAGDTSELSQVSLHPCTSNLDGSAQCYISSIPPQSSSKSQPPTKDTSPFGSLPSSTPHASNSALLPQSKPITRTPSTRSRRSPALGPSPLRIVTLPDMSISEFGALSPRISSPRNDGDEFLHDASFAEKQSGNYSSIGLGRPSTWGKRFKTTLSISDNSDKESSPKPPGSIGFASTRSGSKIPHEEAEELILEIIRDLVEETSGWDSSLHMEDSFRSLVRNAGITPQNSREDMRGACTDQRELPFVESVASPIEIDLGLLGLDAYRMQCAKDDQAQITESRFLEYGMPLTTLEEEEGEEADVSSQVGLAW